MANAMLPIIYDFVKLTYLRELSVKYLQIATRELSSPIHLHPSQTLLEQWMEAAILAKCNLQQPGLHFGNLIQLFPHQVDVDRKKA